MHSLFTFQTATGTV